MSSKLRNILELTNGLDTTYKFKKYQNKIKHKKKKESDWIYTVEKLNCKNKYGAVIQKNIILAHNYKTGEKYYISQNE